MIDMIEPTDPTERAIAIKICRANAYLHPDTGLPDQDAASKFWSSKSDQLPYAKWIWMWNHGRAEWQPGFTNEADQSVTTHEGTT